MTNTAIMLIISIAGVTTGLLLAVTLLTIRADRLLRRAERENHKIDLHYDWQWDWIETTTRNLDTSLKSSYLLPRDTTRVEGAEAEAS